MGRNKTSTKLSNDRLRTGLDSEPTVADNKEDNQRGQEGQGGMVSNRFDLEQEILECWRVTSDIKLFVEQGADLTVLSKYYDQKFEKLWSTFESMCHNGKLG